MRGEPLHAFRFDSSNHEVCKSWLENVVNADAHSLWNGSASVEMPINKEIEREGGGKENPLVICLTNKDYVFKTNVVFL